MEVSIFPHETVKPLRAQFVEARLHSDAKDPELRERIGGLVETVAGSPAQPIYVTVDTATEEEVSRLEGATLGDPDPFAEMLQKALDR